MSEIVEEIRKALESATPGPWEADDGGSETIGIFEVDGEAICYLSPNVYSGAGLRGLEQDRDNAHLIANAPTWLRTLLEERDKDRMNAEYLRAVIEQNQRDLQQLREELSEEKRHAALGWEQSNKWLEENGRLRAELDQVKKELERYKKGDTTNETDV